jgi:AAA domain
VRDGARLDGQQFPPLAYNVPGLMPAGFGIIAGPPKLGKSLLVLNWLITSAIGGVALGKVRVGPARDVLYFALEDRDRRLQARCRVLLGDGYPIPGRLRYVLAVPPGQVLAVIRHALGRYPDTKVVVIDTLAKIMPLPFQGETTTSSGCWSPAGSSDPSAARMWCQNRQKCQKRRSATVQKLTPACGKCQKPATASRGPRARTAPTRTPRTRRRNHERSGGRLPGREWLLADRRLSCPVSLGNRYLRPGPGSVLTAVRSCERNTLLTSPKGPPVPATTTTYHLRVVTGDLAARTISARPNAPTAHGAASA